jgi:hypothetical protein
MPRPDAAVWRNRGLAHLLAVLGERLADQPEGTLWRSGGRSQTGLAKRLGNSSGPGREAQGSLIGQDGFESALRSWLLADEATLPPVREVWRGKSSGHVLRHTRIQLPALSDADTGTKPLPAGAPAMTLTLPLGASGGSGRWRSEAGGRRLMRRQSGSSSIWKHSQCQRPVQCRFQCLRGGLDCTASI